MKSAYEIAEEYGNDMRVYGMSLYWSSPREVNDPTPALLSNPDFQNLSKEDQKKVLDFGRLCKQYGMGCYQERGFCAELYHDLSMKGGPKNPFPKTKSLEIETTESQPE